jgi:hypothetical protein
MTVIPGRAAGASPESIVTRLQKSLQRLYLKDLWLWIPGSSVRSAPQ